MEEEKSLASRGFTLIELMIVVAISGILAGIAIPAYQDFTIRAQVVEAFSLTSELKGSIQEFRKDRARLPTNNGEAGLPEPGHLIGNYVTEIDGVNGALHVHFGNKANSLLTGKILTLQSLVVTGSPASPMSWRCGMRAIPNGMKRLGRIVPISTASSCLQRVAVRRTRQWSLDGA